MRRRENKRLNIIKKKSIPAEEKIALEVKKAVMKMIGNKAGWPDGIIVQVLKEEKQ